ncbi:MAG: hypothetical protein HRU01_02890 [Myxococcales bacterium]|nr:hypothetical protein [Myxococcales bacterium]
MTRRCKRVVFYVSGHGYGHATRMRVLAAALVQRAGDAVSVHVRTEAPHWIFTERAPATECSSAPIDVGVLQKNGLDLDLPETLAAHERFVADFEPAVAREATWLTETGASLVVADIPPLAFAAARRVGVPAVGVANFSWDWILDEYTADEPRFRPIVERYAAAYSEADTLFRLPFHGPFDAFPNVVDAPLLVNRATRSREETLGEIGLSATDERPLVLVSFGGFGRSEADATTGDDLSAYRFAGFGPPPDGLRAEWHRLPDPSPVRHEDLMRACDAILGKPGYGTLAEAAVEGTRFVYLPRVGFREVPVLEAQIERYCPAHCMPRTDFESGRWREHLDAVFELPHPTERPNPDGHTFIASRLCNRLDLP